MCGILAQYALKSDYKLDKTLFDQALNSMFRRGPDDAGVFSESDRSVLIGMRRLSIIDTAGGRQPLANEDGQLQIVGNGEIYNFRTMRTQLIAKGHRFNTGSDIEPLVHQYEEMNSDLKAYLSSINGMFGIALLDRRERRLIVARDRMGIKPLYMLQTPQFIAFASEIKPLQTLWPQSSEPDVDLLPEFLQVGYLLGSHSGFKGIQRIMPGECFVVDPEGVRSFKYWSPLDVKPSNGPLYEKLCETLPAVLEDQLVADVSTGLFLSGGLDSALMAGIIARDLGRKIQCFTLAFDDPTHDESSAAKMVAKTCELPIELISLKTMSPELIWESLDAFTEPLGDMSILPTFVLSRQSAPKAKVVLSGDGGDELFGGYPTQFLTGMHRWFSPLRHLHLEKIAQQLPSSQEYLSLDAKLKALTRGLDGDPVVSHFGWKRLHEMDILAAGPRAKAPSWPELLAPFRLEWSKFPAHHPALKAAWMDCVSFLPDDVLQKTDRVTMYNSQESRVPLLDNRLIDLGLMAPLHTRGSLFNTKKTIRKLLRKHYRMPDSIWNKPKQGFSPPLGRWINDQLESFFAQDLRKNLAGLGLFNLEAYDHLLGEHQANRHDHSRRLWTLAVASRWLNGQRH